MQEGTAQISSQHNMCSFKRTQARSLRLLRGSGENTPQFAEPHVTFAKRAKYVDSPFALQQFYDLSDALCID
jgi:hypothetical protein